MAVFPLYYNYGLFEIHTRLGLYPYEGAPEQDWDYTRFVPGFWRHLESCIAALRELRIVAEIILFHPYDTPSWGFSTMDREHDLRYLRYAVARLSAYSNVRTAEPQPLSLIHI